MVSVSIGSDSSLQWGCICAGTWIICWERANITQTFRVRMMLLKPWILLANWKSWRQYLFIRSDPQAQAKAIRSCTIPCASAGQNINFIKSWRCFIQDDMYLKLFNNWSETVMVTFLSEKVKNQAEILKCNNKHNLQRNWFCSYWGVFADTVTNVTLWCSYNKGSGFSCISKVLLKQTDWYCPEWKVGRYRFHNT